MIRITSPSLRFNCLCSHLPPGRVHGFDARSSLHRHRSYSGRGISLFDCGKPWASVERLRLSRERERLLCWRTLVRRKPEIAAVEGEDDSVRRVLRFVLWTAEAVYILWLFLLPYAPGDPVWAISSETVNSLVGLSLNFFFVLPLMNHVGIHVLQAPVCHPMSEGLFNFVIAWTLMFAPLLYTDCERGRYKGSLDVLWGLMMFLTNTFLIPYMAVRLNDADPNSAPNKRSKLGDVMTNGAKVVALTGATVCLVSAWWALFGRTDSDFGGITDRWQFLIGYLGSERLAYAFIWDICLYTIFQPWLIGENIQNVKKDKVELVKYLRFIPVIGLFAYLLFLNVDDETQGM